MTLGVDNLTMVKLLLETLREYINHIILGKSDFAIQHRLRKFNHFYIGVILQYDSGAMSVFYGVANSLDGTIGH